MVLFNQTLCSKLAKTRLLVPPFCAEPSVSVTSETMPECGKSIKYVTSQRFSAVHW